MITLITLFYASLIAIIAMIYMKHLEETRGKQTLVARLGADIDHVFDNIHAVLTDIRRKMNKNSFIVILQWTGYYLLYPIRKVYVALKHRALSNPHSKKVIDAVRGRGEIRKVGVSAYLRRIGMSAQNKF